MALVPENGRNDKSNEKIQLEQAFGKVLSCYAKAFNDTPEMSADTPNAATTTLGRIVDLENTNKLQKLCGRMGRILFEDAPDGSDVSRNLLQVYSSHPMFREATNTECPHAHVQNWLMRSFLLDLLSIHAHVTNLTNMQIATVKNTRTQSCLRHIAQFTRPEVGLRFMLSYVEYLRENCLALQFLMQDHYGKEDAKLKRMCIQLHECAERELEQNKNLLTNGYTLEVAKANYRTNTLIAKGQNVFCEAVQKLVYKIYPAVGYTVVTTSEGE